MKIVKVERLIDVGQFSSSEEWKRIEDHITKAIKSVEWPPGSGAFILYDQPGKKRGEGNGVKPIKEACMRRLRSTGWSLETPVDIATFKRPGPMDATYPVGDRLFCAEWETGNVSSSHRAINKMLLGMLKKILVGGILILPTRDMYRYLTDRIGNLPELEPYFALWRTFNAVVDEGFLAIIAVEQDGVSKSVPRIPKTTAGRALS
jgi:hypothetical protein